MIFALTSCGIKYQQPEIGEDHIVRNWEEGDTTFDVARLNWRDFYKDSTLCNLIDTAIVNNLDLKIAIANLEKAAAYFKKGKADLFPSLAASAAASYSKPDLATDKTPYFTLGLSASWEIDIWGKLSSAKRGKLQSMLASESTKNAVQTKLISDVATAYFNLIAFDTQRKFVIETIKNREKYLLTVKDLKEAAQVNEIAVLQAESQLLSARAYLPDIEKAIQKTENTICLLLGTTPKEIHRNKDVTIADVILTIDSIGVPASILRNRPDVLAAEHTLISMMEGYNSAKASMYPALKITGNVSSDAAQISQWFMMPASLIWGVVGGLTEPIFNGRALKTQKEAAYQDYLAAVSSFKSSVLNAGVEVSNYLYAVKSDDEKVKYSIKQFIALDKAYNYSVELLINGYASYLDVLSAQQGVFNSQIEVISNILTCATNRVNLYRALGGGWNY